MEWVLGASGLLVLVVAVLFLSMRAQLARLDERVDRCLSEAGALRRELDALTRSFGNDARAWMNGEVRDRDRWPETQLIEEALALAPGMRVVDVGAGGGFFTRRIADRVGAEGHVWALEADATLAERLREGLRATGPRHVTVLHVAPDAPLPEALSVDRVLAVDLYAFSTGQAADGRALLARWAAALAPKGRLIVFNNFVRRAGWRTTYGAALASDEPGAAEVAAWAAPGLRLVRSAPVPARPDQAPNPLESPGYLLVFQRATALERGATAHGEG